MSGGGTGGDQGRGVAVDASGNAYVTGRFTGTADFGATSLTSEGSSDAFVAKLDPSGNYLWAVSGGGTSSDEGRGVAVDASGNAFMIGDYVVTAEFGTTTLTSEGNF